ncbi:MAG: flippase [Candidatus Latescibacteria bacterium]|jgi:O-antigen/teichoic acid export membrane protein|nr:flippase [Candidatus Latescibacterota bacterium]
MSSESTPKDETPTTRNVNRFADVTRNISVLFVGTLVQKVTGAIAFMIFVRYIGEVGTGKYAMANSFTALFAMGADLGLGLFAVRAVSKDQSTAAKYLGNIVIMRLALAAIVLVITGISAVVIGTPRDTLVILLLVAASTFLVQIGNGFRWTFPAFQKMQYEAVIISAESLLMLGVGSLVLVMGYGLVEFTLVRVIFSFLTLIFTIWLTVTRITRPLLQLDLKFCKDLILKTRPFMLIMIFGQVYFNLDIVLLNYFKGDIETSWYNVAFRYVFMLQMIPMLFNQTTFPAMVDAAADSAEALTRVAKRTYRFMIIIVLGIGVMTTVYALPIVRYIASSEFDESAPILSLLIWMQVILAITTVSNNLAMACNRERTVVKVTGVGLLINLILNLALIPEWGAMGAVWAAIVATGIAGIWMMKEVQQFIEGFSFQGIWLRPILASAGAVCIALAIDGIHVFGGLAITLIGYAVILYLIKAIPEQDMRLLRKIV